VVTVAEKRADNGESGERVMENGDQYSLKKRPTRRRVGKGETKKKAKLATPLERGDWEAYRNELKRRVTMGHSGEGANRHDKKTKQIAPNQKGKDKLTLRESVLR